MRALLAKALGSRVVCVFVDTGLLRQGERASVVEDFGSHSQAELRVVDARERFLKALEGVIDPQEKRTRIGHVFVDVFRDEARSIAGARFLAQGTLYPDVIESGGAPDGPTATIKIHHNVGGLPEQLGFELIEPLRDLFKDEVRRLGIELGLPDSLVWRHPFPGPGLAVRCLGEVTEERLEILRQADSIFLEELGKAGFDRSVAQAFAVLLPVQAVGVMGDARTYESVIALEGRRNRRLHDRRLVAAAARPSRPRLHANYQLREGRKPGGLRRDEQAAGDDRVGITRPIPTGMARPFFPLFGFVISSGCVRE